MGDHLVVPLEGDLSLLNYLVSCVTWVFHLYQNNREPTQEDTTASYVECNFDGYAPLEIAFNNAERIGPRGEIIATSAEWVFTGDPANDVYGYYVTNETGSMLFAQLDPAGSKSMAILGDTYRLEPTLTMRTEYGADLTRAQDDFTDPDGTNLAVHVIAPTDTVGATWSIGDGVIEVQSNKAQVAALGAGAYAIAVVDTGSTDGAVSAPPGAGRSVLFARYTDANNFLALILNGTDLILNASVGGVTTTLGTLSGAAGLMTLECRGSHLTATDGSGNVLCVNYSGGIGATRWGLGSDVVGSNWTTWRWSE